MSPNYLIVQSKINGMKAKLQEFDLELAGLAARFWHSLDELK
jgi:hypothetical protein